MCSESHTTDTKPKTYLQWQSPNIKEIIRTVEALTLTSSHPEIKDSLMELLAVSSQLST